MSETITREELTEALRSVRIWVRETPQSDVARLMRALNPADAANDIFISARVTRETK